MAEKKERRKSLADDEHGQQCQYNGSTAGLGWARIYLSDVPRRRARYRLPFPFDVATSCRGDGIKKTWRKKPTTQPPCFLSLNSRTETSICNAQGRQFIDRPLSPAFFLGRFLFLYNRHRETWWRYTITNRSFKKISLSLSGLGRLLSILRHIYRAGEMPQRAKTSRQINNRTFKLTQWKFHATRRASDQKVSLCYPLKKECREE